MYKFSTVFLLVFYIFPFTITLTDTFYFEFIQVILILFGFVYAQVSLGFICRNIPQVDYRRFYIPTFRTVLIVGFLYLAINHQLVIESITHLSNGTYGSWALDNAVKRYEGEVTPGIFPRIAVIFFITYCALLGSYGFRKGALYLYCLLFFFFIIESAGLSRAGILLGITLLATDFIIRNSLVLNRLKFIRYFKYSFVVFFVLIGIFFFSAYMRIAGSEDVLDILLKKFYSYTVAMYQALYIWMSDNTDAYGTTFGFSTFTSVYKLFGAQTVQGFYLPTVTDYGITNIYTNLRGLLTDFGFIGAFIIFFIIGFSLKYYSHCRMSVFSLLLVRCQLYFFVFLLYSPYLFSTVFTGLLLSHVLLTVSRIKFSDY
ncbi:oligosaccharide repeat unit polymerase [Vibrio cholerae]